MERILASERIREELRALLDGLILEQSGARDLFGSLRDARR
jgi:hypothetical protein